MKKVDFCELCTYLANVYKEATGKYYSNDFNDWFDDIERYESNAILVETSEDGKKEKYEVDETNFIKGKCVRINFIIEHITIGDTVNIIPYLSDYDFRKYVKHEL